MLVPQPTPVVTSIRVGDVDIHIGDMVRVRTDIHVKADDPSIRTADGERPPADRSRGRSPSEGTAPTTDPRLMREHDARVDLWERLFRR